MGRQAESFERHPPDDIHEFIAALAVDRALYGRRQPAAVHVVERMLAERAAVPGVDLARAADVLLDGGIGVAQHPYTVLHEAPQLDPLVAAVTRVGSPPAGGTLLLRTSLTTPGGESARDIAFDATASLVVAEDMRALVGCDRIVQVIDDIAVDRLAVPLAAMHRLRRAGAALGLRDHQVLRLSETSAIKPGRWLRREVRRRLPESELQEEVTTLEALCRAYDVAATLGWTRARHLASIEVYRRDERRVDQLHQTIFGPDMIRIYGVPGFADEPGRSRVNPYAWVSHEQRLPLDPAKVGVAVPLSAGMQRHLVRLAARLEVRLGIAPRGLGVMDRITGLRMLLAR